MNNKPGIVYLKEFSDSIEKPFDICKPDLNDDHLLSVMPQQTAICGLDLQHQWYLYENICQHCHSNLAADITCSKPTLPKPHGQASNMVASGTTRKRDHVNVANVETPAITRNPVIYDIILLRIM